MGINLNSGGNKTCFLFLALFFFYESVCSDLLPLTPRFSFYRLVLLLAAQDSMYWQVNVSFACYAFFLFDHRKE